MEATTNMQVEMAERDHEVLVKVSQSHHRQQNPYIFRTTLIWLPL